jgi:hypothetical protein
MRPLDRAVLDKAAQLLLRKETLQGADLDEIATSVIGEAPTRQAAA